MKVTDEDTLTHYAPAGRDTDPQLHAAHELVVATPLLQRTLDAMSDVVLILSGKRQIVGANRHLLEMLQCQIQDVLGKRPGELVGCRNAAVGPDGCGTSRDCLTCGAINAILASQRSEDRVTRECRIQLEEPVGGALDMKVSATALAVGDERYTICVLKDISDEKRLAVLARLFFHDVLNTAGGIQGYVELLQEEVPSDSPERADLARLAELADQLVEEIQAQRDLTYAESGDLAVEFAEVSVPELFQRLHTLHDKHLAARGRRIASGDVWEGTLITDRRLLSRVLGNMLKNALEATSPGQTVTLACRLDGERVVFSVHNREAMPREVQMQVFQRSFSTKAPRGRGIGTHSMKLLGERYLSGQVAFTSREPDGTTFTLSLPRSPEPTGG